MQTAILVSVLLLGFILLSRIVFPVKPDSGAAAGRDRRTGFGEGEAFHAVSIQPAGESCPAVNAISVQRFLSEEAPALPLEGCGSVECRCRYVHHSDRRGGARDRRLGIGGTDDELEFWSQRDRRLGFGRRQGDLLPA